MGETVKVYRDNTGQWFTVNSRGVARNPYNAESCAVLDKLLLNLPPAKPPEQPCEVCGGKGFWIVEDSPDSHGFREQLYEKTCHACNGTGKK